MQLTKERVVSIAMIGHWAIYREAGLADNGNSHLSNFSKNRPKHGSVMSADPDGIYSLCRETLELLNLAISIIIRNQDHGLITTLFGILFNQSHLNLPNFFLHSRHRHANLVFFTVFLQRPLSVLLQNGIKFREIGPRFL